MHNKWCYYFQSWHIVIHSHCAGGRAEHRPPTGPSMWLHSLWDCVHAKSLQLCPALCDPMDHSPPGPSVHGALQAWTLEWAAMPSSRGSAQPKESTRVSYISCIGRRVLHHYCHLLRLHSIPIHEYIAACNLYVYSFVDERLNYLWFEYWAIKNKVSMNIHAQVFVWTYIFISFRWMPRSEIIELCGKYMFNFIR